MKEIELSLQYLYNSWEGPGFNSQFRMTRDLFCPDCGSKLFAFKPAGLVFEIECKSADCGWSVSKEGQKLRSASVTVLYVETCEECDEELMYDSQSDEFRCPWCAEC